MSKEKHQWPESLWVQFPSMLMGSVDIKPVPASQPPFSLYTHHPKLKLQNRKKLLGKNILCVLLKCTYTDLQAVFNCFLWNAEKVMITVQAPSFVDKAAYFNMPW